MPNSEFHILAGGSQTASLNEIAPRFERATGNKVSIFFGSTPMLIKEATSGLPFDLGVVPVDVMQDAAARAHFAPGPTTDIARVGFGVAVRAGAPKPDISTADAFKRAMVQARSIAFLPESAGGAYVLRVFARLGITDAMMAKTKRQSAPGDIAKAVAQGDAELALFLMNVLIAPGVELAGPFPAGLQQDLIFTAATAKDTSQAQAAQAFIDYLKGPDAAAIFRAKGMTPA